MTSYNPDTIQATNPSSDDHWHGQLELGKVMMQSLQYVEELSPYWYICLPFPWCSDRPPICVSDVPSFAASGLIESWTAPWISSQYHRGRNPTRSSPFTTSSASAAFSLATARPDPGTKLARHTALDVLPSVSLLSRITFFRNPRNWCPNSRQTSGSQPLGLPLTRRGIWTVLKDCTVVSIPLGVRNPTTIS